MAGDEQLRIDVQVVGGKEAVDTLGKLSDKVKEATDLISKSGWGNKEIQVLNKELSSTTKSMSDYAKAIRTVNDVNSKAALNEQKLVKAANDVALSQQKVTTELQKQALVSARTEMQNLRLSQAQEKIAIAAQKANSPYNKLNKELQDQAIKLKNAITEGGRNEYTLGRMADKYKRLQGELAAVNQKFDTLTNSLVKTEDIATKITNIFNNFNTSISVALGNLGSILISKAAESMKEFAASISRAGIELDALNNTMLAATGGWESGGREINWVIDMSNRLGLSFRDVSDSYAKFMTSFTRSGGTINQSRQIFEDLSTAMVSLHLPAERMQGVFIALEQMANKGTVQAEELKRQLGNALPGAFELAAESMGILPSKLMDMMKKGEVFSKDFLPAFAATVKQALGQSIDIASVQFNASLGRLTTNLDLFKMNVGQIVNDALLPFVNGLVSVTGGLAKFARVLNENRGVVIAFTAALAGLSAVMVTLKWGAITAAVTAFSNAIITTAIPAITKLGAVLGTATGGLSLIIGATVTGLTALTLNLQHAKKEAGDITPYVGLSQQIVTTTKEILDLNTAIDNGNVSVEEAKKQTDEYKAKFPELVDYLQNTKKSFTELTDEELKNIAALGELDAKQKIEAERIKELDSLLLKLGGTWDVIWEGIKNTVINTAKAISEAVQNIINSMKALMDSGKDAIKNSAIGKAYTQWKKRRDEIAAYNKKFEVKGQKTLWEKGIERAQANAIQNEAKKLEVVEKNIKTTYESLKSAQATASGLVSGGDSKSGKGKSAKIKEADTEWGKLNKLVSKQREQLQVLALQGKEDKKLEEVYKANSKRLEDARKKVEALTKAEKEQKFQASENAKLWDRITKSAKDAAKSYEAMTFNSQNYSSSEIEQARQLSKSYNALVKYSEALKNNDDILKITSRTARDLTNTLVDGLFEPLKEGENIWSRFADAGRSAIKSIATEWVKNKMNLILTGAQAGWGVGTLGEGTFGQKTQLAGIGAMQGLLGKPLFGTKYNNPFTNNEQLKGVWDNFLQTIGAENAQDSVFTELANQAVGLGNTISSNATPAISGLANALTSSGGAGAGMAVLAGTANITATAFTTAVPALTAMATALNAISTSAATAATSMAALAVSTAAESVAKIPFIGGFLAPVAALATGAAIGAGAAMTGVGIAAGATMAGGGQMLGGTMSGLGSKVSNWGASSKVVPHAKGGIVSSPTMFPMQGGNVGVAGEAGTEVIAPARRMSNGDLGIGAVQPNVTVNNYTNAAVEVIKRPDNEMEIKITELNAMLSSSRTNRGMASAQSRMSSQGRRIG